MTALIQRVSRASVTVDGAVTGSCGSGLLILLGVFDNDTPEEIALLAQKTAKLRIFEDETGKMNRSLLDIGGEALVVSQFTLCADTKKGNRPSFIRTMEPTCASEYYERYCALLRECGVQHVARGVFGADMQVELLNDGPVTIILDTKVWCRNDKD